MKKRIGSKEYNTETATELFRNEGGNKEDETWFSEIAYKKRSGELFIWRRCGQRVALMDLDGAKGYVPGEEVLTGAAALAVLTPEQQHEFIEETPKDPDKKEVRTFFLTNRAYESLSDMAEAAGCSKAEMLENIIMAEKHD